MSTRSIRSSFLVRKSSRLSGRKNKGEKDSTDSGKNNLECDVEEPSKKNSVVSAIKNVFHKRDNHKEESSAQETDLGSIKVKHNKSGSESNSAPRSPLHPVMAACCGGANTTPPKSSTESLSSRRLKLTESPGSTTCSRDNGLAQACRRLLSPTKRKSDRVGDENSEFSHGNISPVKSPRSSASSASPSSIRNRNSPPTPVITPPASSLNLSRLLARSPLDSVAGGNQVTPRSVSRLNTSRLSTVPTSTPRRLFGSPEKKGRKSNQAGEGTPRKQLLSGMLTPHNTPPPSLHKQNTKPYQSAKRCLHTAKPTRLIGRDKECQELEDFLCDKLEDKSSGSLYVSGPPGTGKTAVISHVVDSLKSKFSDLKVAFLNCMTLRDSSAVFAQVHEQLTGSPVKGRDGMKAMEKLVTTTKSSVLMILDEIDQLDSKHHHILYTIFEWPALKNSKLVLVGIANALDLTDRVLPRLQASVHCRPTLMNFAPYTSAQITEILKHRLERETIVEPSAINFCARKISAVAGDMRKALDVCRRAVEIVEADVRTQTVLKPQDCNSPTKRGSEATPVKKVTLAHISRVMSDVYGGGKLSSTSSSATNNSGGDGEAVPLQQKLAVCSLLVLLRTGKLKEVLMGKLHDAYSRVCRKRHMPPVDQAEFLSVLSLLDARGIVNLKKAKDTRLIKVSLQLDEQELETTLKDKVLMATILKEGIPK